MTPELPTPPPAVLALGLGLLLALMALEYAVARKRGLALHDARESAASFAVALGQQFIKLPTRALMSGVMLAVWPWRLWTVPLNTWWGIALLFVAVEFNYYWFHRASHRVRWFWASHAAHHSPTQLNLTSAYRLGWTGGLSGTFLLFLPLILLGFHPLAVVSALAFNLLYQFGLHTQLVGKLGPLEWVLNTPSHHRVHHARNDAYIDANFGGVVIVFDRLFGTFVEERADEPCRFGLAKPLRSHNPFVIVFHEWAAMLRELRGASSGRGVAAILFGRPR
jgi:sterol desaturase/sphingolipid hydroxylase (fatty acid hydroxylase superfamily)